MKPFEVGALRIEQLVARGGAGEVWRATHLQSGLPVAVKVLTGQKARDEGFRKSFTREMRALAGLDHPGIVRLFEHGEVSPAEEVASQGRFVVGSPYLVMEFAGAGTLPQAALGSWAALRDTLLALLDALAHAHAKGMVHRDIKPANLLLCGPDQARPGLKLSDFGIAHTIEWDSTVDSLEEMAGTLHFMAPEQATGAWRDYGPWTDLYSVGCVAWVLSTGKLPYANKRGRQLLFAQLSEPPPAFVPAFPVPPDFEAWLRRMLRKDWSDRYLRAADAAWGLARVERAPKPAFDDEPTQGIPRGAAGTGGLEMETLRFKAGEEPWRAPPIPGHTTARLHLPEGEVESHGDAPPIPRTWRRPEDERLAPDLFAAGLSLLPHRSPPLLGRHKERDALWTALRAVHRTHKPRVVIVEGAAGAGRTHLVRWLIERAHEVGAAERLALPWRDDLTPPEVLRRSLSASLRAMRLSAERTEERLGELAAWLGAFEGDAQRATVRLLVEGGAAGLPTGERHRIAVDVASRIATRRPLIWWMDDADRCPEATELALRALEAEAPVLIVLGATGVDWAPQAAHQARLKALLEHGRTSRITLPRLSPEDHLALCREHLRLTPTLAAELAAHTAGDPAFALRLVEDQLQRGQLRMGPEGIERSGATPRPWPADLDGVWADRLAGALEGLPDAARRMLELAAALGDEVDEELWAEAADDPEGRHTLAMSGATPIAFSRSAAKTRNRTVERLLAAGLAVESGEGFAFANRRARAAAAAPAKAGGRWAAHHALCAAVLSRRQPRGRRELAERLGHHLLAAGRLDEAIEALLEGVAVRANSSGPDDGLIAVDALERTLIAHGRAPPSEVHTRLQLLAARLHAEVGNWAEAAEAAETAVQT